MFVVHVRWRRLALLGAAIAAVLALTLLLSGCLHGKAQPAEAVPAATAEERAAYLAGFGWSVNGTPKQTQQVRIPKSADDRVFSRYNALQKSQGFDLTAHAGKEATRYVYEILNYPDASAPVYASVLVLDGHIIGGDITDTAPGGAIHGFCKPGTTAPNAEPSEATEAGTEEPTEPSAEPSTTS